MKESTVNISVIVCTYNGASRLKPVVDSLLGQNYDAGGFEILIVDNDSTDKTREVCEGIIRNSPKKHIEYHFEKNRGLSHARNRGIQESKGEIVAFIDDDAVADPTWLLSIHRVLSDPTIHAVGGKVLPIFDKPRPYWLAGGIDTMLTILDLGDQMVPFQYPYNGPCGTNMAFRKSVFDRVGYFDPALGRCGNKLLGGEETDLLMRMELNGMTFVYCPDCVVHHHVPQDRLTKPCVRKRALYQGYSIAFLALKHASLVNTIIKDTRSIFCKSKFRNDAQRFPTKSWFHYEARMILYSSYLFFLAVHALRLSRLKRQRTS